LNKEIHAKQIVMLFEILQKVLMIIWILMNRT